MADDARVSLTVKTRSGDLLTVRGDSAAEFSKNIGELVGSGAIAAANALFEAAQGVPGPVPHGEQAAAPLTQPQESYTPPWQDAGPPAQQLPASLEPRCETCGSAMRYEEWVGKQGKNAGKQFKAWKCTRDRDHKVQWVN